jgi:leucyl aminopeptidase
MVHVIIKPKGEVKNKVCLVGKGVTYDSGGLDIKVGGFMKTMKVDMGGSATMFGVMKTLSDMDLQNTEVHWISAWVENMVDGASYKSDDVLTTYSGQTVEIWNTDAEGRLTLADALTLATLQDPDYIIDTATLTGAAVRSVSEHYTAMMGNDYRLISTLEATFIQEGEKTVHTPLPEVLRKEVKGKVGQFVNTSKIGPMAGHLTAGLFLSHFVDQRNFRNSKLNIKEPKAYAWAHLDIAGSVWNKNHNNLEVDGATGQSVRSLAAWILDLDK